MMPVFGVFMMTISKTFQDICMPFLICTLHVIGLM